MGETGDGICSTCRNAISNSGMTCSASALSAVASGFGNHSTGAASSMGLVIDARPVGKPAVERDAEADAAEALIVQCSDCPKELPWRVLRLADGRCPSCAGGLGIGRDCAGPNLSTTTNCPKGYEEVSVPPVSASRSNWRAARRAQQNA